LPTEIAIWVLHYQSYSEAPDGFDVVLKDIHYEIYVTLHYAIDKESGILARSAIIESREPQAVTVEQGCGRLVVLCRPATTRSTI